MCHLKLWLLKLTLHNDYRYIQIISCLLFLWRVRFLAKFAFSSQWLHIKCFGRRSCRHFSDSICFFILRFHYNICPQWLHLSYFFIIELKLVNRNLKPCIFYYFSNKVYFAIFNRFFICLFLICFIKGVLIGGCSHTFISISASFFTLISLL